MILAAPPYVPPADAATRPRVGLAVESMRRHMTDEGWQLFAGLQEAGYGLHGHGLGLTDVRGILDAHPAVLVLQDKREWVGRTAGGTRTFDERERFTNVHRLAARSDVFKVTILKDAQNDHPLHAALALEAGIHAWIVYYQPDRVAQIAPFVRREHLVRTWHTVDREAVPPFAADRPRHALLSGAVKGTAYPLRRRLWYDLRNLPESLVDRKPHPGYHRDGCHTPAYLQTLAQYRVSICTASVYGYALRKIVESVACGCVVVTNLPTDDPLPEIDAALVRVPTDAPAHAVADLVRQECARYDPERARHFASMALARYDYRAEGARLAGAIEAARRDYP